MTHSTRLNIIYGLLLLLLSSCSQQYYYLNKVRANPKKGSFDISIENLSPAQISSSFEAEIKDAAIKKLIRAGHKYYPKNPQYQFTLSIKLDSVESSGVAYVGGMFVGRSFNTGNYVNYTRNSRGIYLETKAEYLKTKSKVWEMRYDLYYFAQPYRDLRRTRGVVRYMMGNFKHK
jgi:hypothetical protein